MLKDCIKHSGYDTVRGYGKKKFRGRTEYTHRLAYCEANQVTLESIKGMIVRHTCDNPECVNPEHLLIGTHQDNQDDKVARSRQTRGTDVAISALTEEAILYIRRVHIPRHRLFGASALSRKYSVSSSTIDRVIHNQTWKHIV